MIRLFCKEVPNEHMYNFSRLFTEITMLFFEFCAGHLHYLLGRHRQNARLAPSGGNIATGGE